MGPIRSSPLTRHEWDRQYDSGSCKRLEAIDELAHYSVIVGYAASVGPRTLLDVGCGQGVLTGQLKALPYQRYLGIDISQHAINEALQRFGDERTFFSAADARHFQSEEAFDLIIFNECLYYLGTPREVIRHYSELLAPGGRMVVSMWAAPQNRAVWSEIDPVIAVEDAVTIRNQRTGIEWAVKRFAPLK